ncbi:MAG: hypothetical protein Q7K40_00195 [bacterium]|nr:hypothetical protein [bacterium]
MTIVNVQGGRGGIDVDQINLEPLDEESRGTKDEKIIAFVSSVKHLLEKPANQLNADEAKRASDLIHSTFGCISRGDPRFAFYRKYVRKITHILEGVSQGTAHTEYNSVKQQQDIYSVMMDMVRFYPYR